MYPNQRYAREQKKRNPQPRPIWVRTFKKFEKMIKRYKPYSDIYICVATTKKDLGAEKDLLRRQVLMCDFDIYKEESPHYGQSIEEAVKQIKKKMPDLYNHAIVCTGGGIHVYVAIEPTSEVRRASNVNKEIAAILGADLSACSVTQLVRVPETINYKYDKDSNPISETKSDEKGKPVSIYNKEIKITKPYTLEALERLISKQEKQHPELHKVDWHKTAPYHCIEKMLNEGADKGERNFCLGRITKCLQDIKGYRYINAKKKVLEWNKLCRPPKSEREVKQDFESYWNNDYHLLGCSVPDENKQAILNNYCDRYHCKTIRYGEFAKSKGETFKMNNKLLETSVMRRLNGCHYLILSVLHIADHGLTLAQINEKITGTTSKPCISPNTLRKVLNELAYKYISYTNKIYELTKIANYGKGYTRFNHSTSGFLINRIVTPQEYLVYLAITKNLQHNIDVSYDTLSRQLEIDKQNIKKLVNSLDKSEMLIKEKANTAKGFKCNRYIMLA